MGWPLWLASEDMTVAVADIQTPKAEEVATQIEARGGRAFPLAVDVTDPESLAAAAKDVEARAGGVNLLCANAGVLPISSAKVEKMPRRIPRRVRSPHMRRCLP